MEERTPKWDNLENENAVWGRSELLYMSVLVEMDLHKQKATKMIKIRHLDRDVCYFLK